jgi:hypothetical protein
VHHCAGVIAANLRHAVAELNTMIPNASVRFRRFSVTEHGAAGKGKIRARIPLRSEALDDT